MSRKCLRGWRMASAAALLTVCSALVAACTSTPADPDAAYIETLQAERAAKDAAFRSGQNSPILAAQRNLFLPLKYFPADPVYAVPASFAPSPVRTPLQMLTSNGKLRDMERVGTLEFTLKGRALSLGAFVETGTPPSRLFVPFTDLTSGTETYPAGRYLEIDRRASGAYVIDFNRAFHPYCYYNADYDCPYPPQGNRLPIPVRAGEKLAESTISAPSRD